MLRRHLRRLKVEAERIDQRLQRVVPQKVDAASWSACDARLERAAAQRQRLLRLIEAGQGLLAEAER